jgi:signal transduction histidine kinase
VNPLHSVVGRLTLALFAVVGGALVLVYLVVVPSLENRLIDSKIAQLEDQAVNLEEWIGANWSNPEFPLLLDDRSRSLNARIAIIYPLAGRPPVPADLSDTDTRYDVVKDPIAIRTIASGRDQQGTVRHADGRYAEVTQRLVNPFVPSVPTYYVLLSAPLHDSLETVKLVEKRLILAGLFALALAIGIGYGAARMFAGRIKRLERAAGRIAAGRFDEPVVDSHHDELGQLADAFDHMRQRLAHLERARREFIANASHELRTPLFALSGLLELLTDEDLDEDTRQEFLVTSREQVGRLTKLATHLLDLSRIDAGRLHVEREQVELGLVARTLEEEFAAVAQTTDHPLEIGGEEATAVADEDRVLQIGRILLENAMVHTPAGTPVRVRTGAESGRSVLAVEDEGPGIAERDRAQVFERFYRANGAVTAGSGLGLAIARELAEMMGGEIALASQRGRTTFTVALPAVAAREPTPVGY